LLQVVQEFQLAALAELKRNQSLWFPKARSGQARKIVRDSASGHTMAFWHFAKSKSNVASIADLVFHEGNNPRSTQIM
jgi:hypothetical protein